MAFLPSKITMRIHRIFVCTTCGLFFTLLRPTIEPGCKLGGHGSETSEEANSSQNLSTRTVLIEPGPYHHTLPSVIEVFIENFGRINSALTSTNSWLVMAGLCAPFQRSYTGVTQAAARAKSAGNARILTSAVGWPSVAYYSSSPYIQRICFQLHDNCNIIKRLRISCLPGAVPIFGRLQDTMRAPRVDSEMSQGVNPRNRKLRVDFFLEWNHSRAPL